ncbi:MAG: PocR ligand-binding domain-containing protein [Vallitaleaceae bacterium]|nr:PocR ligand-binding domain-containing protein [Vallitaleaceae bacterium]
MPLDLNKLTQYVTQYAYATNVECLCINRAGTTLIHINPATSCEACGEALDIPNLESFCQNAHLYGAYQAERFGGKYIFYCPIGLVHWASPIIINGVMEGALLAGHIHMVDPDEFLIDEIMGKFNLPTTQRPTLEKYLLNIPVVEPKRVNYLSEMLYMTSTHLSDDSNNYILENERLYSRESEISTHIQYYKTMGGENVETQCYPIEKEKQLLKQIALGDIVSSKEILNDILAQVIVNYGGNFNVLKARILELIILLSRAALEGGADIEDILGQNYTYLNQINTFTQIYELNDWISKILERFNNCVFNLNEVKHIDAIYKAMDYIKRNYMNKITLEDVANCVGFSPPYFSTLFKNETNSNFNKYLTKIRVEKSKILLLDQKCSFADIAYQVGFHDQSHFSKNFKILTGLSPSHYRESRGHA